jgi:hypothetical protein
MEYKNQSGELKKVAWTRKRETLSMFKRKAKLIEMPL